MSLGALSRRLVWLGHFGACTLDIPAQDPIGVEGGTHAHRTHTFFSRRSAGLPFRTSCLSFRQQFLHGCLLTIGDGLILLPLYDAGPVDHFCIPLEVVERCTPGPFVCPTPLDAPGRSDLTGQSTTWRAWPCTPIRNVKPRVDVPDEGGRQVADLVESTSV